MSTDQVLEWRVAQLEDDRKRLADAIESLVRLEESYQMVIKSSEDRHAAFIVIEDRVRTLENAMPLLKLTSHWVIVGVLGILSLVGISAYKLIVSAN